MIASPRALANRARLHNRGTHCGTMHCYERRDDRLDDERGATIAVQDFGIGIADDHLPHIFEQFYRVSDPSEKTYPGLGIGLYIVGEIVRRHGGEIHVASQLGVGTTFTVTLPLPRHEAPGGGPTGGATDGQRSAARAGS